MKSTHISFVDEVRSGGFAFCCADAVNVTILFFFLGGKKNLQMLFAGLTKP